MSRLVRRLFSGPLDIIGDIHGECGALLRLLDRLGYDGNGNHKDHRKLVFVGDLVDRGTDRVIEIVRHLMDCGNAQCIAGNHELNLLRKERKHGNGWFYGEPEVLVREGTQISFQALCTTEERRQEILSFLETLPVALEREDLRVVHACWDDTSVDKLRAWEGTLIEAREHFHHEIEATFTPSTSEIDKELARQNNNPVNRVLSGPEAKVAEKFFAGGKWREIGRDAWFSRYSGPLCVIGHYWRTLMGPSHPKSGGDAIFDGYGAFESMGDVVCCDYSAGLRYEERATGVEEGSTGTAMAAVRHPEMKLLLDNGVEHDITMHK